MNILGMEGLFYNMCRQSTERLVFICGLRWVIEYETVINWRYLKGYKLEYKGMIF